MSKSGEQNLVIVESPAKAQTIGKFLGKGWRVEASYGHIRDLPKTGMSIDIDHNFEPTYIISPDKKKRVAELKKLAKESGTVWLASDEDREGEAIAWHLAETLSLGSAAKRIAFHEITETAIKRAIENPRVVDKNLVDAQQARRVLDRLVGYELSPILWKKVQPGLSAGRVQSVAVRLIVEREREIEAFESKSAYKITAELTTGAHGFKAELPARFDTVEQARQFLQTASGADFSVASIETKPAKRTPAAPFTTSTLQQEASRKLGFSVKQTMVVAQRLYEAGLITYMRTDSVHLSDLALDAAKSAITQLYGPNYAQRRQYKTKSAGAQEAHEAIRPTEMTRQTITGDSGQKRLYELIWKRTISSQMAEASLERTTVKITISTTPEQLSATGEVVKFDGFLKVYLAQESDEEAEEESILPPLSVDQALTLQQMLATQSFDRPKPRYTEASLVKQMEEMGIGRPSTYAPTISNVQDREYVIKGDMDGAERVIKILSLTSGQITEQDTTEITGAERGKLFPTPLGSLVNDFLVAHFADVVDYSFTKQVEDEFDEIEQGQKRWNAMISEFYGPFHQEVLAAENVSRQEASGAREVGTDPATGKPIIARLGRYGPMLQLGLAEDDEKPKFAPIPPGRRMEDITLEEALELFRLPRTIGKTSDGQEITANFGRFGPYIKFGKLYVSIKPDDPFTITAERAQALAADKQKSEAEKYLKRFDNSEIVVLSGRFGPYITDGRKNAKVPKGTDISALTLAACQALLKDAPAKRPRRRIARPN